MIIYNWFNEETAPVLLNFIDKQLGVKSSYGTGNTGCWNGTMKLITFKKDGSHFTVIINEEGIKHSKELVELEGIEAFALQEIRNKKLSIILNREL
jgi:hypothetical protein